MSKDSPSPSTQTAAAPAEDGIAIEIEIDPSLLEAALAAVEKKAPDDGADVLPAPVPPRAPVDDLEEDLELFAVPPELTAEIERPHEDRIAVLEASLARAAEANEDLEQQVRDVRGALRQSQTDFERFRARARKDCEEAERRGEERALRALLEVFDNLERARLHDSADPAMIVGGLQMILEHIRRQMMRVGFERVVATRGSAFDPEIHEAVVHIPDGDLEEGAIVEEISAGFRLRGRLFRPARVAVASRLMNEG